MRRLPINPKSDPTNPENRPWLPCDLSDEDSDRHFKATLHSISQQLDLKTFDASNMFPDNEHGVVAIELSLEDMHNITTALFVGYLDEFEAKHAIEVIRCCWLLRNLLKLMEDSLTSMVKIGWDQEQSQN